MIGMNPGLFCTTLCKGGYLELAGLGQNKVPTCGSLVKL